MTAVVQQFLEPGNKLRPMAIEASKMLLAGFLKEPYLQQMLFTMVKVRFQDLRLGKFHVPNTFNLMGCADPSGTLKRNEVAIIL